MIKCINKLDDQVSAILPDFLKVDKQVNALKLLDPSEYLMDLSILLRGDAEKGKEL